MNKKEKLMAIKKELGKVLFNFAEASAVDGTILIYTDTLEVGKEVFVYDTNNDAIPAPDGKYDIEGIGTIVVAGGKITEVIPVEAVVEEEGEAEETFAAETPAFDASKYVTIEDFKKLSEKIDSFGNVVKQLFSEVDEMVEKPVEVIKTLNQRKPVKDAMGENKASKYFESK